MMLKPTKLLLLLGPPGAGKSTLIQELKNLDSRYVYVTPYTTRKARPGEADKLHISSQEMDILQSNDFFVQVNYMYGNRYGTPISIIETAFREGKFPIIDWPIQQAHSIGKLSVSQCVRIYLAPPNLIELELRLKSRGDLEKSRLEDAKEEFHEYTAGTFDKYIDKKIISSTNNINQIAYEIHNYYLNCLN